MSTDRFRIPRKLLVEHGGVCRGALLRPMAASKLCSDLSQCDEISVDNMVQLYNRVLTELLWTSIARS